MAVPSMIGDVNVNEMILRIVDDASAETQSGTNSVIDRIALSMARSAAIRAGRRLADGEREQLLGDLLCLPSPNYTPDGLPVVRLLSESDLETIFNK